MKIINGYLLKLDTVVVDERAETGYVVFDMADNGDAVYEAPLTIDGLKGALEVAGYGLDFPVENFKGAPGSVGETAIMQFRQLVSAHPEALTGPASGITDIARTMAATDGRLAEFENYKSTAHRMYHEFRRAARVNGAPLGVDRTTTYQEPQ